jgi:dTDP-4-dehydrorhamnose reductase
MILLLGASGYIGQAFAGDLRRRRWSFIPLTRRAIDYTSFDILFDYVRKMRPEFIINAAGYAPNPNVDACELAREDVLYANVLLPQTIARVCLMTNTPWGHVSSGSIYTGAKVVEQGRMRIERDFNRPDLRQLFMEHPEKIYGFTEWDEPNFSFRYAPCNFYSGTKALAEESIRGVGQSYVWRPRMLFNKSDEKRNLLWKLQNYDKVYDCINSITHLDEFVHACLDLWEWQAPFGIYNVVNPGAVTTRQIVEMIQRILQPGRDFEYWEGDEEFYHNGAKAPRSNCILDASKLIALGVKMRPITDALEEALRGWQTVAPTMEFAARASR